MAVLLSWVYSGFWVSELDLVSAYGSLANDIVPSQSKPENIEKETRTGRSILHPKYTIQLGLL